MDTKKGFKEAFKKECDITITNGGRFEILGNHTDHNHGLCLAATCDLKIEGSFAKRNDNKIHLISLGMDDFIIDISNLDIVKEETNSSKALVRGIAKGIKDNNYQIGGFDAYLESNIFPGAGVSSSAAFELLIGKAFNKLFNNNNIPLLTLAKIGQYSENVYFGKKSGLLDQIGVAFGDISYIDFKDINNPYIENIDTSNFLNNNYKFVIVNTGGSHAHLSHLYSEIFDDMFYVAHKMGVNYLRDKNITDLENISLSKRRKDRAIHFYNENNRVKLAKEAIKNNDDKALINLINESRLSSTNLLKNMMVDNCYTGSPLEACDIAMDILKDKGACKINGGGFAGSIICLVHKEILDEFVSKMSLKYGQNNVRPVNIIKND